MKQLLISEQEYQIVQTVLRQCIPQRTVWAFGSRAGGQPKPYSDLDLAVLGEAALSLSEHANLADAFSESDLPYKVDIVDWHLISDDFRRIVQANHIEIQTAE